MCRRATLTLACVFGICLPIAAQEPTKKDEVRQQRLEAMRKIADRFTVQTTTDNKPQKVLLRKSPILRFNDPAREFHDATLWAWGDKGRPVCLLAIEQYGDQAWYECISLAGEEAGLSAEADALKWKPKSAGVTLTPYPEAPPPAKEAPRRMAQMKELLGKLSAYEVGKTGSRYELRLMPRPLHRYQDAEANLHDGAIFAFAYGTNPELLALIEARGAQGRTRPVADKPRWHVGFARCGTAEPYVHLDKVELFHLPYARGTTASDPYWNFAYRFKEKK